MAVDLARDLWQELKRHISIVDRGDAANTLVNLLIDHDYDAEDIKSAFKGDSDIKRALTEYLDDDAVEEDLDEEDEDDYDDSY